MSKIESKPSVPSKKRLVVSYDKMSVELQSSFKEKYPKGYADYMGDIFKVDKPDGSFFYAVSVDVLDAVYLVKIAVKIDDYDDLEKGLFPDGASAGEDGDDIFPEDADSSFSGSDSEED